MLIGIAIAAAIALGALLLWLGLRWVEPHLIYFPTGPVQATPAAAGLPYEAVRIATADGETLQAWWIPAPASTERLEPPAPDLPALLFFHGNAGSREHRLHNLAGLHRAGLSVLIFDYRGYGGSTGTPSEAGLLRDGLAAAAWLHARVGPRPVVYFGRSLGGAVAAQVAAELPAQAAPAGLVLESTFTSAREMALRVLPLPGVQYVMRSRFDTRAALRALPMPLLLIHGDADEMIPFAMGQALYREAAALHKTFRAVPGGHHNDTYVLAGEDYWRWLRDFLQALPQ